MATQSCAAPGLVFRSLPPAHRTQGLLATLLFLDSPSRDSIAGSIPAVPFPRTEPIIWAVAVGF